MAKCKLTAAERDELQALTVTYEAARSALYVRVCDISSAWQHEHDAPAAPRRGSFAWRQEQRQIDAIDEACDALADGLPVDLGALR